MNIIAKKLSLQEFQDYVKRYHFGRFKPNKLVIHHTWKPTQQNWNGKHSIQGLKRYYERKGWRAGPHLFVAEDGIWLFTPMNKNGIHAGIGNWLSIGIEVVGDYDREKWSGETRKNALGVIRALTHKLELTTEQIKFHRDYSKKSCPGYSITKEWLFQELNYLAEFNNLPKWGSISWDWGLENNLVSRESKFHANITKGELITILHRYHLTK